MLSPDCVVLTGPGRAVLDTFVSERPRIKLTRHLVARLCAFGKSLVPPAVRIGYLAPGEHATTILFSFISLLFVASLFDSQNENLGNRHGNLPELVLGDSDFEKWGTACKADVWAFGIILLESITGTHPLGGEHSALFCMRRPRWFFVFVFLTR